MKALINKIVPKDFKPALLEVKKAVNQRWFRGNNVYCPCCQGEFSAFMPYGTPKRPNAQCPQCEVVERHRLLWLFLSNETNLFSAKLKVLHTAPEDVLFSKLKSLKSIEYSPVDMFPEFFHAGVAQMDITNIEHSNDSFDVILSNHVLEHVSDDIQAMKELYRVLKPSGWAILQVPIDADRDTTYEDETIVDPKARKLAFGQWDHVRVFGNDYKERLESAGFTVSAIDYLSSFSPEEIIRKGLKSPQPNEIYFCTKK